MKKYTSLLVATLCLALHSLQAEEAEQKTLSKQSPPKYIISMKVEEVGQSEQDNKIISSSVFECEEGVPARLSISSSNPDLSLNKLIDIEACINSSEE